MTPKTASFISALSSLCQEYGASIWTTTANDGLHVRTTPQEDICLGYDPAHPLPKELVPVMEWKDAQ